MKKLRIAFFHPAMVTGGAERFLLNAGMALQKRGHHVVLFTAHFDSQLDTGSLQIKKIASFLPRSIAGQAQAFCTVTRMAAMAVLAARSRGEFEVALCDQVAHATGLLSRNLQVPVVYYCHYPDRFLVRKKRAVLALYRNALDSAESRGILAAKSVLVNSRFTAKAFQRAFPAAASPSIVYPCVDPALYQDIPPVRADGPIVFLSVNRFHRQKQLKLAIHALRLLRPMLPTQEFARIQLVLAGSAQSGDSEAHRYLAELRQLAEHSGLAAHIELVPNPSDAQVRTLLERSRCVVYTPEQEHFGYGPVEAMSAGRAVVAVNSGGVTETVLHGLTGLLCAPNALAFADALAALARDSHLAATLGAAARIRATQFFGLERMGELLEQALRKATGLW